mmetsp:Transcript_8515/g.30706  ORF Transcript_8515/g.30706 Transcript_8515/m.30706 type:complete len:221 (-) Transcript_8515:451-1113(-)
MPTNSHRWRWVKDFSARKTGPISKTLPKSAQMAICLQSCGDCARQALRPMYLSSKTEDPPSLEPAMILGVWISTKSLDSKFSRKSWPTADWMRKMAWFAGVLRSMKRLSSLVSWLTWAPSASSRLHASAISKGSGAALETTNIPVPWISTCLMVHPSTGELGTTATPVTSTTLSLLRLVTYLTIPLLTTFCSLSTKKTHCTVAVRSLSTTKADLPFPRTA